MPLDGHSILIVESGLSSFITALQAAIDGLGAESLVARDAATAIERCRRFKFSAALINIEHEAVAEKFGIPTLLYRGSEKAEDIVASLEGVLSS